MSPNEKLLAWREKAGLSVTKAAEMAGISAAHWSDIERRKRGAGIKSAHKIEQLTGIPVAAWLEKAS